MQEPVVLSPFALDADADAELKTSSMNLNGAAADISAEFHLHFLPVLPRAQSSAGIKEVRHGGRLALGSKLG
jgi:hypothetical protein